MYSSYDGTNLKPYTFAASIVAAGVFVVLCISGELFGSKSAEGDHPLGLGFCHGKGVTAYLGYHTVQGVWLLAYSHHSFRHSTFPKR